jgi:hypothetical protein
MDIRDLIHSDKPVDSGANCHNVNALFDVNEIDNENGNDDLIDHSESDNDSVIQNDNAHHLGSYRQFMPVLEDKIEMAFEVVQEIESDDNDINDEPGGNEQGSGDGQQKRNPKPKGTKAQNKR